jgi:hypothetical protein
MWSFLDAEKLSREVEIPRRLHLLTKNEETIKIPEANGNRFHLN